MSIVKQDNVVFVAVNESERSAVIHNRSHSRAPALTKEKAALADNGYTNQYIAATGLTKAQGADFRAALKLMYAGIGYTYQSSQAIKYDGHMEAMGKSTKDELTLASIKARGIMGDDDYDGDTSMMVEKFMQSNASLEDKLEATRYDREEVRKEPFNSRELAFMQEDPSEYVDAIADGDPKWT